MSNEETLEYWKGLAHRLSERAKGAEERVEALENKSALFAASLRKSDAALSRALDLLERAMPLLRYRAHNYEEAFLVESFLREHGRGGK